ncbi:hypothetical protein [Bacteroides timonensis]|uniref:hypothetical protein n=1 Tax=Bacteroides timonensis TaxID=1470345 RepID=UPI0005C79C9A|nr:hypothetical protein [Bacteroides timonensis]
MGITEIILSNEAFNDGCTIYLYRNNDYWCAYEISAFLLYHLGGGIAVDKHVFTEYQVRMPMVTITDEELQKVLQYAHIREKLLDYEIIHCRRDAVEFSNELYASWAYERLSTDKGSVSIVP